MGAKCLLMELMTPHSPHLGTPPAHSVSLSASPTTATLDHSSISTRQQNRFSSYRGYLWRLVAAGCGLFVLLTPLYRNTGAAHPSRAAARRIYIWRSRANICINHVSSVTTCLHTVQCPTIVTLNVNYASITRPVSGRRKGREQRDEYKLCFVPGNCCGCGVLSSVPARMSPRVSVIARTYLVLATVPLCSIPHLR